MLKYLRDASERPVAKILMGVLIFSFVGWGAANWILGQTNSMDNAIMRIGGTPLKLNTFEQERNRALQGLTRDQQKQIYADKNAQVYFSQQILTKLSTQMMLDKRAAMLGLTITDAGIAAAIRNEPMFQDNGRFSSNRFDAMLANNGMNEDAFAAWMRASIARDMLVSAVSGVPGLPDFLVTAMFNARYATRGIQFASVNFADFKTAAAPTDSQLSDTYAKNPKRIPEMRTISYVLVPAKMDDSSDYDRAYAVTQKLEDALIGGDAMASAATKFNARYVALPAIASTRVRADGAGVNDPVLTDPVMTNAFALDEGGQSDVIETKSGFAIIQVEKIDAAHNESMDAMRPELVSLWKLDEQKKQAYLKANEILTGLNAGKSIGPDTTVGRATGAPIEVLNAAFANAPGTKTIVPAKDAFYVVWVRDAAAPKADAAKTDALKKEATAMLSRTIVDDYSGFLNREYPVKINNKLLNKLFGGK